MAMIATTANVATEYLRVNVNENDFAVVSADSIPFNFFA